MYIEREKEGRWHKESSGIEISRDKEGRERGEVQEVEGEWVGLQ